MGTIVITLNASLDGVVQDPDGLEGVHVGGWVAPTGTANRDAWAEFEAEEVNRARALLLGRRTYEWLARRWAPRGGSWANRLNSIQKYLVSSTISDEAATWGPTTVVRGDPAEAVADLKRRIDGEVVVYASSQLTQLLIDNDLVDELRVFIHPWVLGTGTRLLGHTSHRTPLRLVSSTVLGDSLPLLTYDLRTTEQVLR